MGFGGEELGVGEVVVGFVEVGLCFGAVLPDVMDACGDAEDGEDG